MTPAAAAILEDVARTRRIRRDRILSRERTIAVSRARQEIFARLYALRRGGASTGAVYSSAQIGRWFERDHSTVLWGIRAHEARMAEGRGA